MTGFSLLPRGRVPARFGVVRRTALFAGGAVAGIAVSALAGYGLIALTVPRGGDRLAAAPMHARPVAAVPEVQEAPLPAAAPLVIAAPEETAPTPRAPAPARLAAAVPTAPAPLPEVIGSMGQPDIALAPAEPAEARPEAGPSPAALAALTEGDAAARSGAALVPGPAPIRPEPRPDMIAAAVAASVATEMPAEMPTEAASVEPAVLRAPGAVTASIRPMPRPAMLAGGTPIRVAAAQPATAPTPEAVAPAPRRSGILAAGSCGRSLARAIPRRRGGAPTGTAFFASLGGLAGPERDRAVIAELARGNVPGFLRLLRPVSFRGTDSRGVATEITICVAPDYLALGSDGDYVRTPLGLPAAAHIAGLFDMTLPTPHMVDAIYAQANIHLAPAPMPAGPQMTSTGYLLRHNATIEAQLRGRSGLIAGDKKDVVMASRMASNPGRVAIYGWHRLSGRAIQPVSTVHQAAYRDYSHGIRLVSRTAFLNGKPVDIDSLLASPRYAWLLNSDGPLPAPVIRTASR